MTTARRVISLLALGAVAAVSLDASAWFGESANAKKFDGTPHVKVRFSAVGTPVQSVAFTTREKQIVEAALQQYNQLPNAGYYLYEASSSDTCVGEQSEGGPSQPSGTICIMKKSGRSGGQTKGGTNWCEIELGANFSADDDYFFKLAAHELGHCLGRLFENQDNVNDWMEADPNIQGLSRNTGGVGEHVGMTRDTQNGISFRKPFTQNFILADFTGDGLTDILVRDSSLGSNTTPWHLIARSGSSWSDQGQVISDFGQLTSLNWFAGDFTGDGCMDLATSVCDSCDPGDGAADAVSWYVRAGNCNGGFGGTVSWIGDFGNGEDYDQFRVGDFDGNGCDDLWLIRNRSSSSCDGNETDVNDPDACTAEIWVSLANKTGSACTSFTSGGSGKKLTLALSERSAPATSPWVVGNFVQDPNGCRDLAYGVGSQSDPLKLAWYVLESYDSDSTGSCDSLRRHAQGASWNSDFGHVGSRIFMAADAGGSSLDDLIYVELPVKPGEQRATWYASYNDGAGHFGGDEGVFSDLWVSGDEQDWTGKVFGVGLFNSSDAKVDFVSLRGNPGGGGRLRADIAFRRITGSGWRADSTEDRLLPSSASAELPILGGMNVRSLWWNAGADLWSNR